MCYKIHIYSKIIKNRFCITWITLLKAFASKTYSASAFIQKLKTRLWSNQFIICKYKTEYQIDKKFIIIQNSKTK
jgi:hypothetical protein